MRTALMFVLVASVLAACGFKGPLTLPKPVAPPPQQQTAP